MRVTIEINRPAWMTAARLRRVRAMPALLVLALVLAGPVLASDRFSDVPDSNVHHDNISVIADAGITRGCNAEGTLYCPETVVTRDQMASFIARTAGLGANPPVANADELDGLDSTALQLRVTGSCAAGEMVTAVNADGTVACESDDIDGGDADTLDGLDSAEFLRQSGFQTATAETHPTFFGYFANTHFADTFEFRAIEIRTTGVTGQFQVCGNGGNQAPIVLYVDGVRTVTTTEPNFNCTTTFSVDAGEDFQIVGAGVIIWGISASIDASGEVDHIFQLLGFDAL